MASFMSLTTRRLRIYYLNNKRTCKCIILLTFCLLLYVYFGTNLFKRRSLAYVGYRHEEEEDVKWPSDGEVQSYLDSLDDTRPSQCLDQAYDFVRTYELKETVSIIMHYHDNSNHDNIGHFKMAISAVVEHTPFELYEEIVVIDDGSRDTDYKRKMASFLSTPKFNKVKVYRSENYDGTASTRHKASLLAKGSILIFISSDVIVNHGWAQPLIAKVASEINTVAVPHYDNMLSGHRFFKTDDSLTNTFSWSLYTIAYESTSDRTEEFIPTSVMRGEVLAVKKTFLEAMGGFDEKFEADGGGDNLELSFRIWLCGGAIKIAKCSRVAVHSSLRPIPTTSHKNYRRIIDLWLTDHREILLRQGNISREMEIEESEQLVIRKNYFNQINLHCQDFNWYLNHVAKEVILPSESFSRFGKLKTKAAYCIRALSESDLEMTLCRHHIYDREMMFEMDAGGAIFKGDLCLSVDLEGKDTGVKDKLIFTPCEEGSPEQSWKWRENLLILASRPESCLTQISKRDEKTMELSYYAKLKRCSEDEARMQIWEFINY